MQFNYGYLQQSPEAIAALKSRLEEGRWATIPIADLAKLDAKSDFLVVLKAQLLARIDALIEALSPDTQTLQDADGAWDRAQRRYALELMKHQQSEDAAERGAADRLIAETLSGHGTAQTTLSYAEEARFGSVQLERLASPALKPLITQLKLGGFVRDIADANATLEEVVGLNVEIAGKKARSIRVRDTHRMAALALDHTHGALDDLSSQPISDAFKADLLALLKPLQALIS